MCSRVRRRTMAGIMHTSRKRIPLVAAIAAVGAVALPGTASAATVSLFTDTTLEYVAAPGESNRVQLELRPNGVMAVFDSGADVRAGAGCQQLGRQTVSCTGRGRPLSNARVALGDRNDTFEAVSRPGSIVRAGVAGQDGDDTYLGGRGDGPTAVNWGGGPGLDTVDYSGADKGVMVVKGDFRVPGGRRDYDDDTILGDSEILLGSAHDDILVGVDDFRGQEVIDGGLGNDIMDGRLGFETFPTGASPDGADRIVGGRDGGHVTYERRRNPVFASLGTDENVPDDGEAGERDSLLGITDITGGRADDILSLASAPTQQDFSLRGNAGRDKLVGSQFDDSLVAGDGADEIVAQGGNDDINPADIFSPGNADGDEDRIFCDVGVDTVFGGDSFDRKSFCERSVLGTLRLTPRRSAVSAGERARLALTWTHPVSWKRLRAVRLTLRNEIGAPVGTVTIRPHAQRLAVSGGGLGARGRVTVRGKRVTAKLALRPGRRLQGRRLTADVEAVARNGRRQLETGAAVLAVR